MILFGLPGPMIPMVLPDQPQFQAASAESERYGPEIFRHHHRERDLASEPERLLRRAGEPDQEPPIFPFSIACFTESKTGTCDAFPPRPGTTPPMT
jgi:hypothetical protein